MCRSIRGLLLGCLAFSIVYIVAGSVQVTVGVVFMLALPIFRLASNIWTGIVNIILGFAVTGLVCCGRSTVAKHKICVVLSIGVVIINLINLLVLEIWEWRAFLPPDRIQNINRDEKTDLLLTAYLTSTISTAVALVIAFVACEYIYCLLIAGSTSGDEEDDKPCSMKRTFPCRTRRASSYEPISFSWVFEASDNFHSGQNSLLKPLAKQPLNTVDLIPKTHPPPLPPPNINNNIHRPNGPLGPGGPGGPNAASNNHRPCGSVGPLGPGGPGGASRSSSGYSSPDWLHQQPTAQKRHRNHYENIEFFHLNNHRLHLSQDNVKMAAGKVERDSRSLVQLPTFEMCSDLMMKHGVSSTSTLPIRGHRKRALSDSKGRRAEGKSPRKRHKIDWDEVTSFVESDGRLSSTPDSNSKVTKLPRVPSMSTIECTSPEDDVIKHVKSPDIDGIIDFTAGFSDMVIKSTNFVPSTSNAVNNPTCHPRPNKMASENGDVVHEVEIISRNGLQPINVVEICKDKDEVAHSTWKLFRKPSWGDLEKSKYSKSDDGVVFRSLDRHLKDKYLESGTEEKRMMGNRWDSSLHWKPMDRPLLNPLCLDDCDSLVNLSHLELMARQWRTCHLHEQMRKQITSQLNRDRDDESSNHDRFAFKET